ncbi:tetratricopeptide repeat protein [candidate division WOR-3 bacterium]|nr:tetratricopeptide repeat protein [candidate division WOR-3 bacterium]
MKYKILDLIVFLALFISCSKKADFNELIDSAGFHLERVNRLKTGYEDSQEVRELLDKALKESEKAVELRPESPEANGLYARALYASGRIQEAYGASVVCLRADSLNSNGNLAMGNVFRRTGDLEKAEFYIERAVLSDSSDLYLKYSLALLYQERRKFFDAESILENLLDKEPDNIRFLYSLAAVNEEQRDLVKAERLFRELTEKEPENPDLWRSYAMLLEKGGDTAGSKILYFKADSIEYSLNNE